LDLPLLIATEREGFEPPIPCGIPDFESGAFNQLSHLSSLFCQAI
jgi:hypothetical protein